MRKVISVLLLSALLLCSITGCHGSKGMNSFVMPDEFNTSRDYEITFWAKNDTNKTQTGIYEQAISDFEALYPNVKIKLKLYTDYGRIYNDVITNIATNTTPNVCITYPDHVATYLTGTNSIVALDELLSDKKYGLAGSEIKFESPSKEEVVQKYLEECSFNGHYYALPFMRSTEACYINKTYVEKLGFTLPEKLTWDFIWEVSEAALEKDGNGNYKVNGQKVMIPFIYKSTDNMMIQMLKQKNAPYSDDMGNIGLFNDTTKELLYEISEHAGSGAFSTFKISSYPANYLNAGQCIFAIDSTAGATWMGARAHLVDISEDKLIDYESAVMEIPQFDTENPKMISQGPSVCVFNKTDPQEVLASFLFTQFLLTNKVQIGYAQTEGYIPVTTKAQNSVEYQEYINHESDGNPLYYDVKLKATKLLLSNIENTFVTPVFNGSASLRDAAGQLIENTAKSARRNEAVNEEYIEKLYSDMNSLHRLENCGTVNAGKKELGSMPVTAKGLLLCIGITWITIILYAVYQKLRKK